MFFSFGPDEFVAHHVDAYQWGDKNNAKFFDGIEKCWSFHQAPWQFSKDKSDYAVPDAKWW